MKITPARGNPAIRYCSDCQESKPLAAFYANKRRPGGYDNLCKSCRKLRSDQWWMQQPRLWVYIRERDRWTTCTSSIPINRPYIPKPGEPTRYCCANELLAEGCSDCGNRTFRPPADADLPPS